MEAAAPVTVVETPAFLAATQKLLSESERAALVNHLAHHPDSGDLIQGTGGLRKLRWAVEGRGKRGGARVIYFFHSSDFPVFALTAYAKNEKADLTQKDRNDFRRLTKILIGTYGRKEK